MRREEDDDDMTMVGFISENGKVAHRNEVRQLMDKYRLSMNVD